MPEETVPAANPEAPESGAPAEEKHATVVAIEDGVPEPQQTIKQPKKYMYCLN